MPTTTLDLLNEIRDKLINIDNILNAPKEKSTDTGDQYRGDILTEDSINSFEKKIL